MLEVSRVGVAGSDDEIELSLELSIGGSYGGGKCEKPIGEVIIEEEEERVVVENVIPRTGFAFPESSSVGVSGEQAERESSSGLVVQETVDPNRKREIQALRRLEARRKREEKMRKSSVNFRGGMNVCSSIYNYDRVGLEAQRFQERAQDRKIREEENFLVDDDNRSLSGRKMNNDAVKNDEKGIQNHDIMQFRGVHASPQSAAVALKNGGFFPYGAAAKTSLGCAGGVRKEENEMKEKHNMFQPVACGSFRHYLNGTADNVRQNSGPGFDSGHHHTGIITRIVNQNGVSNGSLERTSSAISDYRSTSGRGGSISDTGSHSSCLEANDRQSLTAASTEALNQPEVAGRLQISRNIAVVSKESDHGMMDNAAPSSKPDPSTSSKLENSASCRPPPPPPPKQQSGDEVPENPSKNEPRYNNNGGGGGSMASLAQMPCVSTTGNGPNGKTISGFLYRYTKAEVTIVCVCHGRSFSPAEFVEHAGGTDITNPLRHITMVPSAFG